MPTSNGIPRVAGGGTVDVPRRRSAPRRRRTPKQLGPYEIGERVGEGGMGVVFRAFDARVQRTVAIKLLHERSKASHRPRLLREARALAQLSHPNVVQVFDVGAVEHQVYLVMEFVEGTSLHDWLAARTRTVDEILDAFEQVAVGLQAAHDVGLVHRDFKASNALIGSDGRVRVADFGLVQLDDPSATDDDPPPGSSSGSQSVSRSSGIEPLRLTRTDAVIGTPGYISPEQYLGDAITPASDQFSFCVALWEALYHRHPFAAAGRDDLVLSLVSGQLRPLPRGLRDVAHLRSTLAKGLSPRPSDRFRSMNALMSALRRAHRRGGRRIAWRLAGVGVAGLSAGLLLERPPGACDEHQPLSSTWNETRRADVERAVLATGLPFASSSWQRVATKLDAYAIGWQRAWSQACAAPAADDGRGPALVACLSHRRAEFEAAVELLADADAELVIRSAESLGLTAIERCDDPRELAAGRAGPIDPEHAAALENLRGRLAAVHTITAAGRHDAGFEVVSHALHDAERLQATPLVAEALFRRGVLHELRGSPRQAEADLKQAFDLAQTLGHDRLAAHASAELAALFGVSMGRPRDAEDWTAWALSYAARSGDPADRARALIESASIEVVRSDYVDAVAQLEDARALLTEAGDDQAWLRARVHVELGRALQGLGRFEDALKELRQALAIRRELLGDEHPTVAATIGNIGLVLYDVGSYDAAVRELQAALGGIERAYGPRSVRAVWIHRGLGTAHCARDEYAQCEHHLRLALELQGAIDRDEHPEFAMTVSNLGMAQFSQGKYSEAGDQFRKAVVMLETMFGADSPDVAMAVNNLGCVSAMLGHDAEAAAQFERSLELKRARFGPDHPLLASTLDNLGSIELRLGRPSEAYGLHREALRIAGEKLDIGHPQHASSTFGLGRAAAALGRAKESRALLGRTLGLLELGRASSADVGAVRFALAEVTWDLGERARAFAMAEQAHGELVAGQWRLQSLSPWLAPEPARVERWFAEHRRD